jgi:HK97 family phage prohead protease
MNQLHHSIPVLELRAQTHGRVSGYGSVFGVKDSYGEAVAPGAFTGSLAAHKAAGTRPVMLWSHRTDEPIGKWTALTQDPDGLLVEGQLNLNTSAGKDAYEHLRAGDVTGLSIGYFVKADRWDADAKVRVLTELDLQEVSVVAFPANPAARITGVKSHRTIRPATIRDLEEALGEIGYSRREARAIAAKGFAGLDDDDQSDELLQSIREATQLFRKA